MKARENVADIRKIMESIWTGDVESAFFDSDRFDKYRQLNLAEYEYNKRINKNSFYVLGVDVGRFACTTEVVVIKVTPAVNSAQTIKQIVNLYTIDAENFIAQAIKIKHIFNAYKCRAAVVDGNGVGAGLIDLLVVDSTDPETGEVLYGWGVINDEDRKYKNTMTENTIHDALYIMKANQVLNSEMYAYCKTQLTNGRLRFLIDERTAKEKLLAQAQGQKMSAVKRAQYLKPYVQTNILKDQMLNLIQENEGAHIILKQSSKKIPKDKFSALIYGLYFCKLDDDKRGKRKSRDLSQMMLFTKK